MKILFSYDSSVSAAPAAFKVALQKAADILDAAIASPITVTIKVGWGENNEVPLNGMLAAGGPLGKVTQTFLQYIDSLKSAATTNAVTYITNSLPTIDPTNGRFFSIGSAQAAALGVFNPNTGTIAGSIGFSSTAAWNFGSDNSATGYDFLAAALHEITHSLGRANSGEYSPGWFSAMTLYNYSAPGVLTVPSINNTANIYFSIDGGKTNLNYFSPYNADPADWALSVKDDAFGYGTHGTLPYFTFTDLLVMESLGYKMAPAAEMVASESSMNEGTTDNINIKTVGVGVGQSLSYAISGITSDRLGSQSLTGTTTVDGNGNAVIALQIFNNKQTNGETVVTVTLDNNLASTSVVINDAPINGIAPEVFSFKPIDGSSMASINENITIIFNETIQKGMGAIEILTGSANGKVIETFDAATSSNISISGAILTIHPSNSYAYNTHYFVTLAPGTVKDLAGYDYQGTNSYDFTTSNTVTTALSTYTLSPKEPNDLTYIGSSDFTGTGDVRNNIITSGIGNDKLDGGKGLDSLIGGNGNDTYIVDSIKDIVIEETNAGIDTIQSSLTFSLTELVNVENLTLIGSKAINGSGNILNNTLLGNSAKNSINGGLGNDILSGGNGADTFQFNTTLNSNTNVDTMTDFVHGVDKIQLSRSIMSNLNSGTKLSPFDFVLSTKVLDASDRIIYDPSSGVLSYDADGSGASAAIEIAIIGLVNHAILSSTDFKLV